MKSLLSVTLVLLLVSGSLAADTPPEEGFVSLFDGKTLDGWKVGENADLFQVRDGMIVMECPATTRSPAHLFYAGEVNHHDFKNFDLKADVMTFPGANSGIYFHTKYQEAGWPNFGIECQVNNSHADWRRTGSLWGIRNLAWGPETPPKNNKEDVAILPSRRSRTASGIPKRSSIRTDWWWSSSTARPCSSTGFPTRTLSTSLRPRGPGCRAAPSPFRGTRPCPAISARHVSRTSASRFCPTESADGRQITDRTSSSRSSGCWRTDPGSGRRRQRIRLGGNSSRVRAR